ncbi:serine hydrolase [Neisseria bacilliformis]|uniref:serine hydrolase n=1 Tax=Neisseria bacilliformis TaxID=267212 RepID=UPI0028E39E1B|nr:serine hydrolase [Neisseria bacilliformis]
MFQISSCTKAAALFCGLFLFSLPAAADDMDVLGQFLQQNLPADQDPLGTFITNNPADMLEAQAAIAGPLLASQSALILNNRTGEVLYQKNMNRVMPIASISKLMSAMVTLDARLNMNEVITITEDEIDRIKGTGSRLSIGTQLTRAQLLHLSLMSSENRATHALGRTYPGGMAAFVAAMNAKAQSLGMADSRFYEPTGLDYRNVSTASDLSKMVAAAAKYPQIRSNSTSTYGSVYTSAGRQQNYKNSNALVREGTWDIELQKTGYIRESGRSMVVKARIGSEPVTIVLLNSPTTTTRVNDARSIQIWMLTQRPS